MPVTTPTRSPSWTKSTLLPLSAMRWPACSTVAPASMKTAGRVGFVDAGAEDALHALRPVRVGESVQLLGNLGIEEGREAGLREINPITTGFGTRKQSVSSAAVKSSPAAPWTRARLSKLSFGPSTALSVPPSRASTEPLMTTCSASEAPPARGWSRPAGSSRCRGRA
jgi:hypothetical protein